MHKTPFFVRNSWGWIENTEYLGDIYNISNNFNQKTFFKSIFMSFLMRTVKNIVHIVYMETICEFLKLIKFFKNITV